MVTHAVNTEVRQAFAKRVFGTCFLHIKRLIIYNAFRTEKLTLGRKWVLEKPLTFTHFASIGSKAHKTIRGKNRREQSRVVCDA